MSNMHESVSRRVPEGHAQVQPGGALFTSIGAAMASIDPSVHKQYSINLGAGTFREQVTFKAYVHIKGTEGTTIVYSATENAPAAVLGATNSSLQDVTISATASEGATNVVAISLGDGEFGVTNCIFNVGDGGIPVTYVLGIFIEPPTQTARIVVVNSTVDVTASSAQSTAIGLMVSGNASVDIDNVTVVSGARNGLGIGFQGGGTSDSQLVGCRIAAQAWSVNLAADTAATITAIDCTLQGPVSPGVTVNP